MHQTVLLAAAGLLAASLAAQSPLTTLYAQNNQGSVGGSILFDLTANIPVTIP